MPVTTPEMFTLARLVLLLVQVPPVELVASVVVPPVQTVPAPDKAPGNELTVTVAEAIQPVGNA
jgi:hypothetical protein